MILSSNTMPALPFIDGVVFRHVPDFPGYCVGDDGNVYSCMNGRWGFSREWKLMMPNSKSNGYRTLGFRCRVKKATIRMAISAVVLTAFVGPRPERNDACHGNGDPLDDRLSNLRWGTRKDNVADTIKHGRLPKGEDCSFAKLTVEQVLAIRAEYSPGTFGYRKLSKKYGVSLGCIVGIITKKRWSHI